MKKIFILVVIIMVVVQYLCVNIFAYSNENIIQNNIPIKNISEIKSMLDKSISNDGNLKILGDNEIDKNDKVKSYEIANLSKVYILEDLFLNKYNEGNKIADLITNEYFISIPIMTENNEYGLSTFTVDSDGKSKETGTTFGLEKNEFLPKSEEVLQVISNDDLKDVEQIKYIHSYRYYTTFVYIQTKNENEYLIPYSEAPNMVGLSNGKIYSANELVKQLSNEFDEDTAMEEGDHNGGTPRKSAPTYVLWIFLSSFTLLIIMSTLLIKKKLTFKSE